MAAQMQININSGVSPDTVKLPPAQDVWASLQRRVSCGPAPLKVSFDPSPLDVEVGDQIFWTNNDSKPHWPSRISRNEDGSIAINQTSFMDNQIAGGTTSTTFAPGVPETIEYVCSLHREPPCSEAGTIVVNAA
ncbi:MAG: cupredoxin domain-containing protein [Gammaproteobacteria bacterium]